MKPTKVLLPFLLLLIFACEEQASDTTPNTDVNATQLSRLEIIDENGDRSFTAEYEYEEGLLVRQTTTGGLVIEYHYEEGVLVRQEHFQRGIPSRTDVYEYSENRLLITTTLVRTQDEDLVFQLEYLRESTEFMRINRYDMVDGSPELQGYSICEFEGENVVLETDFSADGVQFDHRTESSFDVGINPKSLWTGHPKIENRNMFASISFRVDDEVRLFRHNQDFTYNEENLPVEHSRLYMHEQDTVMSTMRYFYRN